MRTGATAIAGAGSIPRGTVIMTVTDVELAGKTRIWEGERSSGARRNGWSHMEEIMVLWLASGETGRGCRRLNVVLGGDREAQPFKHFDPSHFEIG